jgi:hypothetical protein
MSSSPRTGRLEPRASKMDGVEWRFLSESELAMPPPMPKTEAITKDDLDVLVQVRLDRALQEHLERDDQFVAVGTANFMSPSVPFSRPASGLDGARSVSFERTNDAISVLSDTVRGAGGAGSVTGRPSGLDDDDNDDDDDDDDDSSASSDSSTTMQREGDEEGDGEDGSPGKHRRKKRTEQVVEVAPPTPAEKMVNSVFDEHEKAVEAKRKRDLEEGVTAGAGTGGPVVLWRPPNEVRITNDVPAELLKNVISTSSEAKKDAAAAAAKAAAVAHAAATTKGHRQHQHQHQHQVRELTPEEAAAELKSREKEAADRANAEATTLELLDRIRSDSPEGVKQRSASAAAAAAAAAASAPSSAVGASAGKRRPAPPSVGTTRRFKRTGGRGGTVRNQHLAGVAGVAGVGGGQPAAPPDVTVAPERDFKPCLVQHPKPFVVSTMDVDSVPKTLYGMWFVPPKNWQVSRAPGQLSAREEREQMGGKGPPSTERVSAAEASDGAIAGGAMMGADTSVAGGMAGAAGVRRPTTKPPKVKPKDRTPVETYWALEKRSHDARREKLDRTLPSLFIAKQYTDWLADPNNKIERVPAWARELAKRIPHAHHHHHHHQQAAGGAERKNKRAVGIW